MMAMDMLMLFMVLVSCDSKELSLSCDTEHYVDVSGMCQALSIS